MTLKVKSSNAKGDNLSRAKYDGHMPTPGEIIKAAIKRAKPRTTQRELASKLGITESAVSQWVNDNTVPDRDKIWALCEALGLDLVDLDRAIHAREMAVTKQLLLSPEWQERLAKTPARERPAAAPSTTLPVWASAEGGDGAMILNAEPIDQILRPDGLTARDAFSVYLVGESMSPAYEHGDRLFIDPTRPTRSGADCLFMQAGEDGTYLGLAKRLMRVTSDKWRVRQFNPAKDFDLDRKKWAKVWTIVGKMNR